MIIDELDALPKAIQAQMMRHEMAFLTERTEHGNVLSGSIIAKDYEHAKQRANERGIHERVEGIIGAIYREGDDGILS